MGRLGKIWEDLGRYGKTWEDFRKILARLGKTLEDQACMDVFDGLCSKVWSLVWFWGRFVLVPSLLIFVFKYYIQKVHNLSM